MRHRIAQLKSEARHRGRVSVLAVALTTAVGLIVSLPSPALAQAPISKWQAAIDATWGQGLPTERKLEIFDTFWKTIDERFAVFQGLDVDWAALRDSYRPEIAAGVSHGRFVAIMSHLALALRESHTQIFDSLVAGTPSTPGVPRLGLRGRLINSTFGACATAQDDGSALIYNVAPGHPLGVEPGDRILGYDGRPWRELVRELLAAELPVVGSWGSSAVSFEHTLVQSAPVNWHLFDTIDILKHDTGGVEHRSTALLNTRPPLASPLCSEQLPVPGVPKPAALTDLVTWGVVEGTRIGYVYVTAWTGDAGERFEQAIRELTQDRETDGLIIDFRFNRGGNMFLSDAGLGMLFDRPMPTIGFALRADPNDHYKMRLEVGEDAETAEICGVPWQGAPPSLYVIDMCDRSYDPRSYNRPIAVLTGPARSARVTKWRCG